jgi:hypothetical protein
VVRLNPYDDSGPVALIDSIWWILQQVKLRIVSLRRNPTYIIIGITQCQALRDRLTPEWPLKDKMNKIIIVWHTLLLYYYIMLCKRLYSRYDQLTGHVSYDSNTYVNGTTEMKWLSQPPHFWLQFDKLINARTRWDLMIEAVLDHRTRRLLFFLVLF